MGGILRPFLTETPPEGTYSGYHQPLGNKNDADCLVLQELGDNAELTSNRETLDYVVADEQLVSLPAFVSNSLTMAAQLRGIQVVRSFQGPSANNRAENTGTYGELEQLKSFMDEADYKSPVFVTSGHNIGNILRQAKLVEINGIIVPPDLPHSFDIHSGQVWTKHRLLWALTSRLRIARLIAKGH